MAHLFEYRDRLLYCHHSIDAQPDPAEFPMHAHEMLEVFCFLSGKGRYFVEGTEYPLEPGAVMLMRAAEAHKLVIDPSAPYERIAIHFRPELLKTIDLQEHLLRPFEDRPLGRLNLYRPGDLPAGPWRAAFQDFSFQDSGEIRTHVLSRLLLLLPILCDAFALRKGRDQPPQGSAAQLVAYVNDHLFEDISLQSIAKAFYRSPSQISRLFRTVTGSSLWRYVRVKRLLAARAMIQRGESARTACDACGFLDYSSFYRAYKAHFGQSPREDFPETGK